MYCADIIMNRMDNNERNLPSTSAYEIRFAVFCVQVA